MNRIAITTEAETLVTNAFKAVKKVVEPRDYQLRVCKKTVSYLTTTSKTKNGKELPHHSALIESPTGSGKTVMALIICSIFHKMGYSIGWCAMRRNLLTQVEEENKKKGFNIPMKYISMYDKNPPKCDFLVVDEAHHDSTISMANIHNKIKPKKIIGLSATPFRADKAELAFECTIAESGIYELIRNGYLALVDHFTIEDWNPETVCKIYNAEPKKWGKTVMFFHTMEDCRHAFFLLRKKKVKCSVVCGATDKNAQIDAFEAGKYDVLINMLILTEGFDCPALETVFVRPSNTLATAQMCGRVLRKFPGLIKKIVQCKDTSNPFPKYAPLNNQFLWHIEKKNWVKVTPDNEKINSIITKTDNIVVEYHDDYDDLALLREKKRFKKEKEVHGSIRIDDKDMVQDLNEDAEENN